MGKRHKNPSLPVLDSYDLRDTATNAQSRERQRTEAMNDQETQRGRQAQRLDLEIERKNRGCTGLTWSVADQTQNCMMGLPWWSSGWECMLQCREHQCSLWFGKILHAAEQLSPCTPTSEPYSRACALQKEKPLQWRAWSHRERKPVCDHRDPASQR